MHREAGAAISAEATVAGSGAHASSDSKAEGARQLGDEGKCEDENSKDCSEVLVHLSLIDGAPSRRLTKGLEPMPRPRSPACRVEDPSSVARCHEACEAGDNAACVVEGVFYDDGLQDLDPTLGSVKLDMDRAAKLFEKACDGGDLNGCAFLGTAYMEGRGKTQDKAKGLGLFRTWCDKGSDYACDRLAFAHVSGDGVPRDPAKAANLYDKACQGGFLYACVQRADMLKHGWGGEKDEAKAAQMYETACSNGEGYGCATIADDLKGKERFDKAREACDLQGFYGCFLEGAAYDQGDGAARSPQQAVRLYRFACLNGGEEDACDALGPRTKRGKGGSRGTRPRPAPSTSAAAGRAPWTARRPACRWPPRTPAASAAPPTLRRGRASRRARARS
jgi:hypothetical protein